VEIIAISTITSVRYGLFGDKCNEAKPRNSSDSIGRLSALLCRARGHKCGARHAFAVDVSRRISRLRIRTTASRFRSDRGISCTPTAIACRNFVRGKSLLFFFFLIKTGRCGSPSDEITGAIELAANGWCEVRPSHVTRPEQYSTWTGTIYSYIRTPNLIRKRDGRLTDYGGIRTYQLCRSSLTQC